MNTRETAAATIQEHEKGKSMKNMRVVWAAACGGALVLGTLLLHAAELKSYQVTGPVLDVSPTLITVQKGNDKWELQRDKNTKVSGDLKVGARVTIYYHMVAEQVEVKEGKAKK